MIDYRIDYLRITVHTSTKECVELYKKYFKLPLGILVDADHGAKGFKRVYESASGFQLKHSPGGSREYCTFEFPGKACEAVPPEFFIPFYRYLERSNIEFNVTRIDLAFDNISFSPRQFRDAIQEDNLSPEKKIVRSLTQRDSLEWRTEALKPRDDNSGLGRDTCSFGSRFSERYMRIYNKRGPTRLELELKLKRASLVADDLMHSELENWYQLMMSHLLDFIDIDKPWWKEFVGDNQRAYAMIESPEVQEIEKLLNWYRNTLSSSFALLYQYTNGGIVEILLREGTPKMKRTYANLLSLIKAWDYGTPR